MRRKKNPPTPINPSFTPWIVPAGWTGGAWVWNLRRVAEACEEGHPDLAAEYRAAAAKLEAGK